MQSFEPGDIFIGCTLLNDPDDDHAGEGRIRQYDKNMEIKGELRTVASVFLLLCHLTPPSALSRTF
jgi:hypothetical protein